MTQERVIAQVKPRLQHCLEQRDRPGILALTTWLVHRHGHPLLQQLLSQPEWSSYRLWWGEQISHLNPGLQPPSELQPQPQPQLKTGLTDKDHQDDKTEHKTPMATKSTSDPLEPTPTPRQHPEPQDEFHLDGNPANQTESLDQAHDDIKLTPAQVTKQRLKMGKSAKPVKPVPIQDKDGEVPIVAQRPTRSSRKRDPQTGSTGSLRLRDWLPRSRLPHQDAA